MRAPALSPLLAHAVCPVSGSRLAMLGLTVCGMVWGYLGVLLFRTGLGIEGISLGAPVILAMLGACGIALALALACVFDRHIPWRISLTLAAAAIVATFAFIWLHRSHTVCEIGSGCVPLF